MSVKVTLNVEADRLAGKYQVEFGAYSPITHMYPSSPEVLEIEKRSAQPKSAARVCGKLSTILE